jgi:predicted DCC family thiol-disulfide oxidoreductase YuxK
VRLCGAATKEPVANNIRFAIMAAKGAPLENSLAMTLSDRQAYSYLTDSAVPRFDDLGPIVSMDGECALCTGTARAIARLGRAVLKHYGLDPQNPDSWLYLVDGKAYASLDGVIRAGIRLGGWGQLLRAFMILPPSLQDWVYRRIARNRYSIFGHANKRTVPDPALAQRLIS